MGKNGQKWPFFKFFRTDFFKDPTQEGVLKTYILVSPLLASKNHLSVSILGVRDDQFNKQGLKDSSAAMRSKNTRE